MIETTGISSLDATRILLVGAAIAAVMQDALLLTLAARVTASIRLTPNTTPASTAVSTILALLSPLSVCIVVMLRVTMTEAGLVFPVIAALAVLITAQVAVVTPVAPAIVVILEVQRTAARIEAHVPVDSATMEGLLRIVRIPVARIVVRLLVVSAMGLLLIVHVVIAVAVIPIVTAMWSVAAHVLVGMAPRLRRSLVVMKRALLICPRRTIIKAHIFRIRSVDIHRKDWHKRWQGSIVRVLVALNRIRAAHRVA